MSPAPTGRPTAAGKLALLERRKQVAALYVKGLAQWEIGQQVGIAQQTVSDDLKAVRKEWRASTLLDFNARMDRELARLDLVERECWAEWERSKKDAQTKSAKTVKTPRGDRTEASKKEEGQCGDPRFLAEVRACVRQRCELLGLIVNKMSATTPDGQAPATGGVQVVLLMPENGRSVLGKDRAEAPGRPTAGVP